jgi:hypothetical protein
VGVFCRGQVAEQVGGLWLAEGQSIVAEFPGECLVLVLGHTTPGGLADNAVQVVYSVEALGLVLHQDCVVEVEVKDQSTLCGYRHSNY